MSAIYCLARSRFGDISPSVRMVSIASDSMPRVGELSSLSIMISSTEETASCTGRETGIAVAASACGCGASGCSGALASVVSAGAASSAASYTASTCASRFTFPKIPFFGSSRMRNTIWSSETPNFSTARCFASSMLFAVKISFILIHPFLLGNGISQGGSL